MSCKDEARYHIYVSELSYEIESLLLRFTSLLTNFELQPHITYSLSSRGKRLRPLLLILSGQSLGGVREALTMPAVAIELVHTASLIHDDVLDFEGVRRDLPTLYCKLGSKALLVGDVLYASAVALLAQSNPKLLEIIAESTMELCDGEFMDVSFSISNCKEEDYFRMIRKKSASLFKAAAECGAVVVGGLKSEVETLSTFGELFGIAYQLKDDLQDILGQVYGDFVNGRVTLPYLHLYTNGDSQSRLLVENNIGKGNVEDQVAEKILEKMEETGSIDYCRGKLAEYKFKACQTLASLKDSEFKDTLIWLTQAALST
ncbi:MAG: polyprenyl synthetase family protein [Candidatus Bathyarchaeia archaeon]